MRNQPSPNRKRSLPSNFGDGLEGWVPHVDVGDAEVVIPLAPELRRVDHVGKVELDVSGPAGFTHADDASCDAKVGELK